MDEAWRCHRRLNGVAIPKVREALTREYADWLALAAHDHSARVRTFRRQDDAEAGEALAPRARQPEVAAGSGARRALNF